VPDGVQDLNQNIQEQVLKSAQDFYGNSLGSIKSQLEDDRSQLQEMLEQLSDSQEDARAQLEALLASTRP
jgi:RNA binding exosome subunit